MQYQKHLRWMYSAIFINQILQIYLN
uniref:Uncharacterized protein n=1 Tax=Heterorhabditis bacteriophora TaxID=37862 RepID=A0A1I7WL28_HETBA